MPESEPRTRTDDLIGPCRRSGHGQSLRRRERRGPAESGAILPESVQAPKDDNKDDDGRWGSRPASGAVAHLGQGVARVHSGQTEQGQEQEGSPGAQAA
jgi:hypothetical protein